MIYKIITILCLLILTTPASMSTEPYQVSPVRSSSSDESVPKGGTASSVTSLPAIGRRQHEHLPLPLPMQEEERVSVGKPLTLAAALEATQDPLEKAKLYAKAAKQFVVRLEHENAATLYLRGAHLEGVDESVKKTLVRNAGEQYLLAVEREPAGNVEKKSLLYQNAGQCFYGIEDFRRAVECYRLAKELASDTKRKELLDRKISMCYQVSAPAQAAAPTLQSTPAEHIQKAEGFLKQAKARVKSLEQPTANDSKASELFEAAANRFHLGGDDVRAAKYYDRAQDRAISREEKRRLSALALGFYTRISDTSNAERMTEIIRIMENRRQLVEQRRADDQAFEQTAAQNRRLREEHLRTLGLVNPDGTVNRDLPWKIIAAKYQQLTTDPRVKYLENLSKIHEAYEWLDRMTTKS